MQYLKYPTKVMKLSQNYNSTPFHFDSSHGTPKSYPIDETCGDNKRDYFYAPCDVIIKRIYGVGNNGTNTIWLESKEKVIFADGTINYATIMVIHPNDDTLKSLKVNQEFKQGKSIFLEGNDGNATGYHFHIEVAKNKFSECSNSGWVKNSKNAWVLSGNTVKPEKAFWIDQEFTKIINSLGLSFKDLKTADEEIFFEIPNYDGVSIVDALKKISVDSSFSYRKKISKKNNISLYIGNATQNLKLLSLLKEGKLLKP